MNTLLVCTATRVEHDACAEAIRTAGARRLESLLVGVGPGHAARRLRERLTRKPTPTRILSTGFAGALSADVPVGAWIDAQALFEWKGGVLTPVAAGAPSVATAANFPSLSCELISADHFVGRDSPLRSLRCASNRPRVIDMESAALAREAATRGIAFSVARVVSDTPDQPLPEFLEPFSAALAGSDAWLRVALTARGFGSALADPRGIARLLSVGRRLTKQLRLDFARLARQLDIEA
ncbi:MAG TPA: hypothetical protein VGJ91_15410 [Polyangiaceae bacterium]|jgi:nucleoside phosphorylase